MSPRNTPRSRALGEAHQAELDRLGGEERRARWRARWGRLRAFWGRIGKKAKRLATAGTIVATLGKPIVKLGIWARAMYRAGEIGKPVLPPPTGTPTTALDFVPEPTPAAKPSGDGERH